MVKKTIELDRDNIDEVRTIFKVRTDKEAVNKALELTIIDGEIVWAHHRAGGIGEVIDDVFE